MPTLAAYAIHSPFGNTEATLQALAKPFGMPAMLEDHDLLGLLTDLGRQCCVAHRPDLLLLATTKGDADAWAASLCDADDPACGPTQLAGDLGRIFACPAVALSAACASGTAALGEAARRVMAGDATRVLVLAADRSGAFVADGFAVLKAATDAACRPFDADRDGLRLGESAAACLVVADPGPVRLAGWGAAMDANHLTGPCRDGAGLSRACRRALTRAGLATPTGIVAHGTGTRYNDDAESLAYEGLGLRAPVTGWKGLLGHGLGSCGVSEACLAATVIATGASLPGVVNLRRPGCAGAIDLLPPGAHPGPWRDLLLANAGFGGLDAAVVLGANAPQPLAPVRSRLVGRCRLDHAGWQRTGEDPADGAWSTAAAPGYLPRLSAKMVTGRVDASWGRMDLASRALVTLGHLTGPHPAGTAVVLASDAGCAATDRAYEHTRRAGAADPQLFPYTLPTTPVGEVGIRCRLQGPGLCLLHAEDAFARRSAELLLAEGAPRVLLARVEADAPPHLAWAEVWEAHA